LPVPRYAAEVVDSPILEVEPGAAHQILHRAGNEDLVGRRERGDAGGNMHSNATELVADDLAFACMQSGANAQVE